MSRNLSQFVILGFLGAFSGAILAGTSLFFIPKRYESSMEIRRVQIHSEVLKTPPGVMYFATEMPDGWYFRSRNSFELISERLKLPERWNLSEYEVLKELRKSVRVEPKRESIYHIAVSRLDPDEAYEIANSLQEVARDRLTKMYSDSADRYLNYLRGEITDQSNKVVERKLVVASLLKIDLPEATSANLEKAEEELREDQALLAKMKQDYESKKREATNFSNPLEVLKSPTLPKMFIYPRVDRVLAIGTVSGLLIGLAVTFFFSAAKR
ncbi:MAG: hypothetical protein IZT59_08375 [Verrucomicrobia bacterium]|jgi:capsular polysaccharide biosynthesis protein|nr:hypothetical protein [Verrucomicrobiota bacterium]|tara:strand:+ start:200 stop:1006 length:807 start_codon:yes stop_codon:yes gene_type:complete